MKYLWKAVSFVVACLFAGAVVAAGQTGKTEGSPMVSFEQLDKNKDGSISKDEAKADTTVSKQFDQWDANRDGKLSKAEYDGASAGSAPAGSKPY
jgi:NADPH-dependent glutamate synthase beta subunit-like oxidoreductase